MIYRVIVVGRDATEMCDPLMAVSRKARSAASSS